MGRPCVRRRAPISESLTDRLTRSVRRYVSFLDLAEVRAADLPRDALAAVAVAFLAVPQGVAYALIAGLPPAMGLYAATLPTIVGSLFRSSRHVVTGPTNAVSLLVGSVMATQVGLDPVTVAVTLALMVGVLQLAAGLLQLGSFVYFISSPVVLGYITGAGVLIAVGQLANITETPTTHGNVVAQLMEWGGHLADSNGLAVAVAAGTASLVVGLRWISPRLPGAIVGVGFATGASVLFGLKDRGLRVVEDLTPIPAGLPQLTVPDLSLIPELVPLAVAVTVLSLVESTSIARNIAARSGQRLDLSAEVAGEGLANLAAAFVGGYPTTGSLSRSALNEREGAVTRLAGVISGVLVLGSLLLLGPVLNQTPIASLAGLLLVVAWRLIDRPHIALVMRSHRADQMAFLGTVAGTFFLHLDQAIYLGVGLSVGLFLRRSQQLSVRDLVVDTAGRLREVSARSRERTPDGFSQPGVTYCRNVHLMNLSGSLFYGAVGEVQSALDAVTREADIRVVVLRLKRARNLDVSSVEVLLHTARRLRADGRRLVLVGMRGFNERYLDQLGANEIVGTSNLLPFRDDQHWFAAIEEALERGYSELGDDHVCAGCALERWVSDRAGD